MDGVQAVSGRRLENITFLTSRRDLARPVILAGLERAFWAGISNLPKKGPCQPFTACRGTAGRGRGAGTFVGPLAGCHWASGWGG